jgi:osmotically-inducible protein OsmY
MFQDRMLQKAVLDELRWEPSVTAGHIGVVAHDGVVTLTGHVESFVEKHAAGTAARRVKGVKAVAEEILVDLPFDRRRTDEDIAAAAVDRLAWDVSIPGDAVTVTVENGHVILTGQLDWHYQRQAAEQDVRGLLGVTRVTNQISIKPQVDTELLSDDLMHAFHRSWFFDPARITVTAAEGRIRLTGSVNSPHERQLAGETAWAAPGATAVDNDIVVQV